MKDNPNALKVDTLSGLADAMGTCTACGALVLKMHEQLHLDWHRREQEKRASAIEAIRATLEAVAPRRRFWR